jgi:hypothetical protein
MGGVKARASWLMAKLRSNFALPLCYALRLVTDLQA